MAYSIISNKKNMSVTLHFTTSNSNVVVAGAPAVSNVAVTGEVITGGSISQIAYGCDGNGSIQVMRGANLVAVFDSTGYIDYAGNGIGLNVYPTANLTVNFIGSANAYCVVELQKTFASVTSDYFQN
jgi:hypothetical protein